VIAQDPAAVRGFDAAISRREYFAHAKAFAADGTYGRGCSTSPISSSSTTRHSCMRVIRRSVASLGLEATNETCTPAAKYLSTCAGEGKDNSTSRSPSGSRNGRSAGGDGGRSRSPTHCQASGRRALHADRPTGIGPGAVLSGHRNQNLDYRLAKLGVKARHRRPSRLSRPVESSAASTVVCVLSTRHARGVYQGVASALVFENGQWKRRLRRPAGPPSQPELRSVHVGVAPERASTTTRSSVSSRKPRDRRSRKADAGITKPQRVTLRKDGLEVRAVTSSCSVSFERRQPAPKTFDSDR
jgi:hypothetical protein